MFRLLTAVALAVLLTGCAHYQESIGYWEAPEREGYWELYEVPLAVLLVPVTALSLGLYPFEQDKERPSFVELGAVWVLLADPTRSVEQN